MLLPVLLLGLLCLTHEQTDPIREAFLRGSSDATHGIPPVEHSEDGGHGKEVSVVFVDVV